MKKIYAPLEQVITFHRLSPKIGWAVDPGGRAAGTCWWRDGKLMVRVATSREDAEEGRYTMVSENHVHPWSEDLWYACEQWLEREKEVAEMYKQLNRGKIPKELAKYQQVNLFTERKGSS